MNALTAAAESRAMLESIASISRRRGLAALVALGAVFGAGSALAQVRIDIAGVGGSRIPVAIVDFRDESKSPQPIAAIIRADRTPEALAALGQRGVHLLPLWPRAGMTAKRAILLARKGSRAPFALLPGLVLHQADGRYIDETDAILRGGAALAMDGGRL